MSATVQQWRNYVGGEWVEPLGDGALEVFNPATRRGRSPRRRPSTRPTSTVRCRRPRPPSRSGPRRPRQRARKLLQIADVIDANRDELGRIESSNVGKPLRRRDGRDGHLRRTTCASSPAPRAARGPGRGRVRAQPHLDGPARADRRRRPIAPWNYPLMMAVWKFGPALADRQHRRPQAVRADAAHAAAPDGADRRGPARRRAERDHRRRRAGRRRRRRATRRCAWSRSPATSRPARRWPARRPHRSSASTSSSAARRR